MSELPKKVKMNMLRQLAQIEDKNITQKKVGRNDPCPCGSGKKYKKCCGKKIVFLILSRRRARICVPFRGSFL